MNSIIVARYAYREILRHPMYWLVVGVLAVLLVLSLTLSAFHLGQGVTLEIVQMGVATMTLSGVLVAILASAKTVFEEIESKTALTILSKPIDRDRYLLGKHLGIFLAVATSTVVLFGVSLAAVEYDRRSASGFGDSPGSLEVAGVLFKGAALSLAESSVICAIAVLLAVWLPLEVTGLGVAAVYLFGHMSGRIRAFLAEGGWTWLSDTIYYLVPNLENFSIDRAIATGRVVTNGYVVSAWSYAIAVTIGILCVALLAFRARELA